MNIFAKDYPLASSWSLLPKSLSLLQEYFVPVCYFALLPALLNTLGATLTDSATAISDWDIASYSLIAISILWTLLAMPGYIYIQLRASQHRPVDIKTTFTQSIRYVPQLIGLQIVYALLVLGGLLLLIVPGLVMLRRYYLAPYYLIDQKLPIREAFRQSAAGSLPVSGYIWGTFGVTLVFILASIVVSSVSSGVGTVAGVLLTYPYAFATVLRYREVTQHQHAPAAKH